MGLLSWIFTAIIVVAYISLVAYVAGRIKIKQDKLVQTTAYTPEQLLAAINRQSYEEKALQDQMLEDVKCITRYIHSCQNGFQLDCCKTFLKQFSKKYKSEKGLINEIRKDILFMEALLSVNTV